MTNERLFLDTAYIEALLNKRDQYHAKALELFPRIRAAREVWLTEAILVEVGNGLSAINRSSASQFIRQCYQIQNMQIVTVDTALLGEAIQLYDSRSDKNWGLTDCISFIVMQQQNLRDAVTSDRHFMQAGYRALMLE